MSIDTAHSWLLMADRTDPCVSILKCGTTMWRLRVDRSITGRRSPAFLGTRNNRLKKPRDLTLVPRSMAPFISKASTACWRSCRLFLVRKLMLWWVSWGRCWNAMPIPSSTMPVARQLPSRLRQCGAKSARRAPTWDPSMFLGCGRRRRLARLLASLEGSWTGPFRRQLERTAPVWPSSALWMEGSPACQTRKA